MARNLKVGDRVRLNVRSLSGWKGEGVISELECCGDWLTLKRECGREVLCGANEVSKIRLKKQEQNNDQK